MGVVVAVTVLPFVAAAAVYVFLLLPAIEAARQAKVRAECSSNLKQIVVALQRYHDDWGSFPPAYLADEQGRPRHSWRVLILPQLGEQALYEQYRFDEPWDSPANQAAAARMPAVYACPGDPDAASTGCTSYLAMVGPNAGFVGSEPLTQGDLGGRRGELVLVAEATHSAVPWTRPEDLDLSRMRCVLLGGVGELHGPHPGVVVAAFGDGSVKSIPIETPPDEVRRLLERPRAEDGR